MREVYVHTNPLSILLSSARRLGLKKGPLLQIEVGDRLADGGWHVGYGPRIVCETCQQVKYGESPIWRRNYSLEESVKVVDTRVEKFHTGILRWNTYETFYIVYGQCHYCRTIYWGVPGLPVAGEWAE